MEYGNQGGYQQSYENAMHQQTPPQGPGQGGNFNAPMQNFPQQMFSQQRPPINYDLYKTQLCRTFQETGTCSYGDRCKFAHGEAELRQPGQNSNSRGGYRGRGGFNRGGFSQGRGGFNNNRPQGVCRVFQQTGTCKFGDTCKYSHQF